MLSGPRFSTLLVGCQRVPLTSLVGSFLRNDPLPAIHGWITDQLEVIPSHKSGFEEVEKGRLSKNQILTCQPKSRVPDTFQFGAIPDARAFLAFRKINNLSVFNTCEYSDPLRNIKALVINKLQRCWCTPVPDEFHGRSGTGGGEMVSPSLRPEPGIGSEWI